MIQPETIGRCQREALTVSLRPAELSLTVPIVNSLAFLFTVFGEWFAEGKIITRGKLVFLVRPKLAAVG